MFTNLAVSSQLSNKNLQWIPRAAPFLLGLKSAQASTQDAQHPDISVYRNEADEAEQWIRKTARRDKYTTFFLRHDVDAVGLYNHEGKFVRTFAKPEFPALRESYDNLKPDRESMQREMRDAVRNQNLILLACAEDHAGASAADQSNTSIVCRRMIMEADSKDLQHFYVGEHKQWQCRVTSIYADISALSQTMQDVYLDRFKWLRNSWPLNSKHHLETLADRLATVRSKYTTGLLLDCGHAAGMAPELIMTLQAKWMLASPGAKYRFAQRMLEVMKDGLIYTLRGAEIFDPSYVETHGAAAVSDYRSFLH